jgi:hypothetical protein
MDKIKGLMRKVNVDWDRDRPLLNDLVTASFHGAMVVLVWAVASVLDVVVPGPFALVATTGIAGYYFFRDGFKWLQGRIGMAKNTERPLGQFLDIVIPVVLALVLLN